MEQEGADDQSEKYQKNNTHQPKALGQCRRFLDAYLPQAARVAVDSTGDGAVRIGSGGGAATFEACIASEVCARDEIYGLSIARRAIQDRSGM